MPIKTRVSATNLWLTNICICCLINQRGSMETADAITTVKIQAITFAVGFISCYHRAGTSQQPEETGVHLCCTGQETEIWCEKITELGCGQWLGCNMSLLFSSDGKAKLQPAPGVPNITTEQHAVGSAFRVLACPAPQSTPGNILKCAWRTSLPPAGSEAVKRQLVIYFHKHSPWCWPMLLQSNKHSSLAFFWNFPCLL